MQWIRVLADVGCGFRASGCANAVWEKSSVPAVVQLNALQQSSCTAHELALAICN